MESGERRELQLSACFEYIQNRVDVRADAKNRTGSAKEIGLWPFDFILVFLVF